MAPTVKLSALRAAAAFTPPACALVIPPWATSVVLPRRYWAPACQMLPSPPQFIAELHWPVEAPASSGLATSAAAVEQVAEPIALLMSSYWPLSLKFSHVQDAPARHTSSVLRPMLFCRLLALSRE